MMAREGVKYPRRVTKELKKKTVGPSLHYPRDGGEVRMVHQNRDDENAEGHQT
jgi:hypothetical protein